MHRWIACSLLGLTGCCIPLPLGDDDEPAPGRDRPSATLTPLPSAGRTPAPGAAPPGWSPATTGSSWDALPHAPPSALADGEVPQVRHRFELFHDVPHLDEAEVVQDGLLLCDIRVSTESDADTFKGPDTSMNVRLGRRRIRTARGPEDSWGAVLSMPVSRLERGDTVWLRVIDRDVWCDEVIGSDSLTFRGRFPLQFRSRDLRVECRMLDSDQVEARVGRPLSNASRAIDRLARALTPDVRLPALGYPELERLRVITDLSESAAWVDWDDPRVAALLDRVDGLDATWQARATQAVTRAASQLPAPGADVPLGPGWEGGVREVRCGVEADRMLSRHPQLAAMGAPPCLARLAVRRADGGVQVFGPTEPLPFETRVLTEGGGTAEAPFVAREQDGRMVSPHQPGRVAAGETAYLWLALPASTEAAAGRRASLLWLRPGRAAPPRGWVARLR